MSIGVHVSFQIIVSCSYMARSGISRSHDNSIFSFLRKLHTLLRTECINIQSHQLCRRVLFSLHAFQHLLFVDFLNNSYRCKLISILVLICISLIISSGEKLFMCLLATYMSSLENCLFRVLSMFKMDYFVVVEFELFVYFEIKPLLIASFANISS